MIFFPSHWLLFQITILEAIDSGEKGMNPVAITIISPRKEYWPSSGVETATGVESNQVLYGTDLAMEARLYFLEKYLQCKSKIRLQVMCALILIYTVRHWVQPIILGVDIASQNHKFAFHDFQSFYFSLFMFVTRRLFRVNSSSPPDLDLWPTRMKPSNGTST